MYKWLPVVSSDTETSQCTLSQTDCHVLLLRLPPTILFNLTLEYRLGVYQQSIIVKPTSEFNVSTFSRGMNDNFLSENKTRKICLCLKYTTIYTLHMILKYDFLRCFIIFC